MIPIPRTAASPSLQNIGDNLADCSRGLRRHVAEAGSAQATTGWGEQSVFYSIGAAARDKGRMRCVHIDLLTPAAFVTNWFQCRALTLPRSLGKANLCLNKTVTPGILGCVPTPVVSKTRMTNSGNHSR
jgi:hypothetical protein